MLPFHLEVLKIELRRDEYTGLSPDAAYDLLTGRKRQQGGQIIDTRSEAEKRLGKRRFIPKAVWDGMRQKDRDRLSANVFVIDDETAKQFAHTYGQDRDGKGGQTGYDIPGFPNKVRRHEFDEAWGAK